MKTLNYVKICTYPYRCFFQKIKLSIKTSTLYHSQLRITNNIPICLLSHDIASIKSFMKFQFFSKKRCSYRDRSHFFRYQKHKRVCINDCIALENLKSECASVAWNRSFQGRDISVMLKIKLQASLVDRYLPVGEYVSILVLILCDLVLIPNEEMNKKV